MRSQIDKIPLGSKLTDITIEPVYIFITPLNTYILQIQITTHT